MILHMLLSIVCIMFACVAVCVHVEGRGEWVCFTRWGVVCKLLFSRKDLRAWVHMFGRDLGDETARAHVCGWVLCTCCKV